MTVDDGRCVALLGANGAGKSTFLRVVSGMLPATAGQVTVHDRDLDGLNPHQIVDIGVALVPEGRQLFPRMSVLENLLVGASLARVRRKVNRNLARVFELFPVLAERGRQRAGTLSGGEQQMLAIGRALMSQPRLLLLDEPVMGLSPKVATDVEAALRSLTEDGATILLVDEGLGLAKSLADTIYILRGGAVATSGPARDVLDSADLVDAYLGVSGGKTGRS